MNIIFTILFLFISGTVYAQECTQPSCFQQKDKELTGLANTTSAADKVPWYIDADGNMDLADFTAFGRSIVGAANATEVNTILGVSLITTHPRVTVATLPAVPVTNEVVVVTDALAASSCIVNGGTTNVTCQWTGTAWVAIGGGGGGGSVAGTDTQVQFNDSNIMAGDAGLTYDKASNVLTVTGDVIVAGQSVCQEDGTNCPSGGAPAFNTVTAGTNTDKLVVGTGGSLGVTGTGTITPQYTPSGSIAANTVQGAIAELDSETQTALSGKQPASANLTALASGSGGFWTVATNVARSFANGTGITWTNPAGVAGNPQASVTPTVVMTDRANTWGAFAQDGSLASWTLGTTNAASPFTFSSSLILDDYSPSAFAADQTDYSLGAKAVMRFSCSVATCTFNSFAGGSGNRLIKVINIGASNNLAFPNESATGTAAMKFLTNSGATVTLRPLQAAWFIYDDTTSRWRVFPDFDSASLQGTTNVLNVTSASGLTTFTLPDSVINGVSRFAADAGSSDAYAACPLSVSTMPTPAYVDGMLVLIRVNTANTGGASLNLCTLGARTLVKLPGGVSTALQTGDLDPEYTILAVYRAISSEFQILSTLKSAGSGAGTPAGTDNDIQFNTSNAFAVDTGNIAVDTSAHTVNTAGGFVGGNVGTNSVASVMGGGISGHKTYTWAVNADANYAVSTGTLTSGDCAKFDSSGRIVTGNPCRKVIEVELYAPGTDAAIANGLVYFRVPTTMNGMNLVAVASNTITAGTTGLTSVQITRCVAVATGNSCSGATASMLSTVLSIDSGESSSTTAAAAAVIDGTNDDVATGQLLRFDVTAAQTTPAKGLIATLEFALP